MNTMCSSVVLVDHFVVRSKQASAVENIVTQRGVLSFIGKLEMRSKVVSAH